MAGFVFIEASADGKIDASKKAQVRSRCMQGVNQRQDSRRSVRRANKAAKEKTAAQGATTAPGSSSLPSVAGLGSGAAAVADTEDDEPTWYPVDKKALAELALWRKTSVEKAPLDVHLLQFGGPVDKAKTPFLLHLFVIFETFQSKESVFNVVDFTNFYHDRATWLATDDLFFQSSLCTMSHMLDFMRGNKPSKLTLFHTHQTMYMLNRRLSKGGPDTTSEPVFWIVLGLALMSALQEDYVATTAHIAALGKIIQLRGGLAKTAALHPKIHHKLEALDTLVCMSGGKQPGFFNTEYWSSSYDNMLPPAPPLKNALQRVVLPPQAFDADLIIAFRDMQHLTSLMNSYIERSSLIDAPTFQKALSAITSRLLHLTGSLVMPSPSAAICYALLTQITTLFAIPGRMLRLEHLTNQLKRTGAAALDSVSLKLWVAVICCVQVVLPDDEWLQSLWDGVGDGMQWDEAKRLLETVIWVAKVHDESGRRAFEGLQEARRQRLIAGKGKRPMQYSFVI